MKKRATKTTRTATKRGGRAGAEVDRLIDEITTDAHDDDEQLWAFLEALGDGLELPCDAFVIGEPVSLLGFEYDGNLRRGLLARFRREDGTEYLVGASEVSLTRSSGEAGPLDAFRRWSGRELPRATVSPLRPKTHKAVESDLDLSRPVELVVLAVKERAARCRLLDSERTVTLRPKILWNILPGEVATVQPRKYWTHAGHPYLSGEILSSRLDVAALGLVPLGLEARGMWNPDHEYWGEEGEPVEAWARSIVARGPRPAFEMEQVIPGADERDPDDDPIVEAADARDAGDTAGCWEQLMDLCQSDLRCLDAHAHLGNCVFTHSPREALRHYEIGVRIGEQSLGPDFDGVLPWGHIDNRPFLRCLHGYGLCLWRLDRFDEAGRVFERMLWFNPPDNQGARFLLGDVRAGVAWKSDREG